MTKQHNPKDNNFLRFEKGETPDDWDLTEKIFAGDHSHKCPTYIHKTPPCQGSCPSGHEIRGWLAVARGMDKPAEDGMAWQQHAFNKMIASNPFPSVMGRVCPAPCEDGCNRNELDDFVGINAVEQYVGDWARENKAAFPVAGAETGKKVAIIGSGPAGLTAAFFLRQKGHGVTIFDDHKELGGMMRFGIPGYRTPRDMLDGEINRIIDMGVEVKLETRVGRDVSVEDLEKEYDAIFWAIGAQKGRGLFVDDWNETENCVSGVAFLDLFNNGDLAATVKKIVVVGGGDTSIDVVSVARRLGHISDESAKPQSAHAVMGFTAHDVAGSASREGVKATLTSLFPIEEMTAAEHEREDALREGVDIKGGVMPLSLVRDENGRATALRMAKCTVDAKGIPTAEEGTEFDIEADLVVAAIGQSGDLSGELSKFDNGRGLMDVNAFFDMEEHEKHFAGGDIVRPHLLTTAIGQASIAAEAMDKYLNKGQYGRKRPKVDVHHFNLLNELSSRGLSPETAEKGGILGTDEANFAIHNYEDRSDSQIIPADELFLGYFEYEDRNARDHKLVQADEVIGNFDERLQVLTEEQTQKEGERCMSCGVCFECDNCVVYCPQDAIFRVKKSDHAVGRYVDTDYTKCIGCHICKDVCPTGYIEMGLGE